MTVRLFACLICLCDRVISVTVARSVPGIYYALLCSAVIAGWYDRNLD